MTKIGEATQLQFSKATHGPPKDLEWEVDYRAGGEFAEQIKVQLLDEEALKTVIMHVNGSGVRVNGKNLALEVRSIHPGFSPAGTAAKNIVLPPPAGGPCL